jgi:putative transposase
MHFTAGGREYEILKRLPGGEIQFKDIVTNVCSAKPHAEIIEALYRNEVELLGDHRNQTHLNELLQRTGVSDLTILEDDDPRRAEMERCRAYVLKVIEQGANKLTEETLRPIIDEVGQSRGDLSLDGYKKLSTNEKRKVKAKPSVSTLIRWTKRYIKSGRDERSFVPATKSRGNRKRKFSGPRAAHPETKELSADERKRMKEQVNRRAERVGQIVDEAVDEVFLNKQRFSVQDVYDTAIVKIADENEVRASDDQLPIPDKSSIYDVINKVDDYDIDVARYGEKFAEEKYKAYKRGPRPTMPLERVEGDHIKLDLFVVDPVMMLPIGRPILTWLVCVYTKMILGFYISFNPYGSLAIMECLKHAIRPKSYVRGKYPNIRNTWEPYGVMKKLVLDNAPEFWGGHLEDACHQLGINIQYGQKGRAWYRATVERSYRTLNTQLIHRQPGTTFSNIFDCGDYQPSQNALITPDTLDESTHKLIIDYLQLRPHKGIKDIPALRWKKEIEQWPPALPAKASDLDIVLGYLERRQIHHYGIEIDVILYNDDDLAMLRRRSKSDERHIVKRNPNDLSIIHVYDKKHDRYLPVPAVDQEYTKGLTVWQHKVIRKYVRERLKQNVDIVSLCRAKLEIQEIVERDWNRASSSRVRMARFRNEGVQDRREGMEFDISDDWVKRILGDSGAKGKLLLKEPEPPQSSRAGVSDLESVDVNHESERGDDGPMSRGVAKESTVTSRTDSSERRQLSKSSKRKNAEASTSKKTGGRAKKGAPPARANKADTSPARPEDEELDMAGWSADYNMPS